MAETQTPNYNLIQPEVGGSSDTWGTSLNGNMAIIDAEMKKAFKRDRSDQNPKNGTAFLNMGGFEFSLAGTAPALPADPETRDLIITCNGVTIFRLSPTTGGLRALDVVADDTV